MAVNHLVIGSNPIRGANFKNIKKWKYENMAEQFKIGSRIYDKVSNSHGTITDIFVSREMDDEEYEVTVMLSVKWDDGTMCITNLHCELELEG